MSIHNNFQIKFDERALEKTKSRVPENTYPFEHGEVNDQLRFATSVATYCHKRLCLNRLPSEGYTCFIFIPVRHYRKLENWGCSLLGLKSNNSYDLRSKIVVALGESLKVCRIFDVSEVSNSKEHIWNKMQEVLAELQELCNEALCNSIVEYENSEITNNFIYNQKDEVEQVINFSNPQRTFSKEELEDFAENFHDENTKLPSGYMKIWMHQGNYTLLPDAENRISNQFSFSLISFLGRHNVFREPEVGTGRVDIYIHPSALESGLGPCVMEFKVLRQAEKSSCQSHLEEGILQAIDYGKSTNANTLYLMAFDARKELGRLEDIEKKAKESSVNYMHFEMFNSDAGERKDILKQKKKDDK